MHRALLLIAAYHTYYVLHIYHRKNSTRGFGCSWTLVILFAAKSIVFLRIASSFVLLLGVISDGYASIIYVAPSHTAYHGAVGSTNQYRLYARCTANSVGQGVIFRQ